MKKQIRKLSSSFSYIGGFLLIIAGYSAHNELIEGLLSYLLSIGLYVPVVNIILFIIVFLGALGGFTVIIGGYAIAKNRVKLGSFLISIGSGFGIFELLIFLMINYNMNIWKGFEIFVTSLFGIGIMLSIISRAILGDYT